MKEKSSFLLHHDTLGVIEELTDQQAGQLIKEIYKISLSLNNPDTPVEPSGLEGLMNSVLHPFKAQLLRDYDKYIGICERNKSNGGKGGRPKEPTGPQTNPSKPDKDSHKEKESQKDSENEEQEILQLSHIDHLNNIYGSISQMDIPQIFEITQKIPDPAEFGRIAKELHSQAVKPYVPGPLKLCQNVFAEINKPEEDFSKPF